jgi:hypothetical protein
VRCSSRRRGSSASAATRSPSPSGSASKPGFQRVADRPTERCLACRGAGGAGRPRRWTRLSHPGAPSASEPAG